MAVELVLSVKELSFAEILNTFLKIGFRFGLEAERDVKRNGVKGFLSAGLGLASKAAHLRSKLPTEDFIDDALLFKLLESLMAVSKTGLDDVVEKHDDEFMRVFLPPWNIIGPDSFNC